jgi:hypothetical protein
MDLAKEICRREKYRLLKAVEKSLVSMTVIRRLLGLIGW